MPLHGTVDRRKAIIAAGKECSRRKKLRDERWIKAAERVKRRFLSNLNFSMHVTTKKTRYGSLRSTKNI